jgi:hypothetical protein
VISSKPTSRTEKAMTSLDANLTRIPVEIAGDATAPATVALPRRRIDAVLVGLGAVATVVLAVAGGLLTWGNHFANDYVHDELTEQHVVFPTAEKLTSEGRTDLLRHAGDQVTNGSDAQAYASYIHGHLAGIADGATYADLGGPESAAKAAVQTGKDSGASAAQVAELQAKADAITNQRNTLFKGETLRGLLLSAYAWSTVGRIAGIAAVAAFIAAGAMVVLVVVGMVHHRRAARA